ncbi:MAG: PD-(D/E)XK nuclease family protein [Nitrososphaerota archaeon]|nr:PD-(D/E)XK nuclease family protein [Nitrososphaerota archaeon]
MPSMQPKYWDYLAWSFTRHRTYETCPRQYWFNYVGKWDAEVPSSQRSQLWDTKEHESLAFLRGKIVHDKIEEILPSLVARVQVNEDDVLSSATERVEEWRARGPASIVEYRNGVPFSDATLDRMRTEIIEQLSTFLHVVWPELKEMEYVQHEKFDRFRLDDIPVTVKLDCVMRVPGGPHLLIDWKTGNDDDRYEGRLQLSAYAAWAASQLGVDLDQARVQLVFLKSARRKELSITGADLERTRRTIASDWSEFSAPRSYEAYPPRPDSRTCTSCRFAKLCPDARLTLMIEEGEDD